MKQLRKTTLEILHAQLEPQSNYRLVLLWNTLQKNQASSHLVPLQDILKARGINVRRGSKCMRRFVDDDRLAALRQAQHVCKPLAFSLRTAPVAEPVNTAVPVTLPRLDLDRVVSKTGKLLSAIHDQAAWTLDTVDPFLLQRTPELRRTLKLSYKTRIDGYSRWFAQRAWALYRVQVHNVRCGRVFKALVQVGKTLVELRAGMKNGERFIEAVPMAWSDLV